MIPRRLRTKNFRKLFSRSYDENGTRNDNIELVVVPSQLSNEDPSTSAMVTVENFQFVGNLMKYFDSTEVTTLLTDSSKVILLKLEIEDALSIFNSTELNELTKKCTEKSIVIFLATKDRKRFFLYWKSKHIQKFLMLKIYDECDYMYDLRLFEFIAKFLTDSLRRGYLGLHSELKIDSTSKLFHLHLLADHRNFNLFLIAAELGDIYIVNFLLDAGFSTESHDTNAQTLAYNGRHFDIVSSLLRSNLTYPQNIKIQECSDDIQEFYQVSQSLNEAMMSRNSEKVLEILSQNPEMKHFYNLDNESALAFVLRHKLLDMYGLLISKDVSFGPHEKFSEIKDKLKESERVELREIHYKESTFMPDNHMHVLLSNTRFAPGTTEPKQKYKIVQKAFEILNENPFIQIILKVVAASRNFRVVFDFDRDSVEHIDPTADASMKGLFYTSGRIYIAAKQLLNPSTKFEALGTLAHELCHYAMNLVYRNMARPYSAGDIEAEQEFDAISVICKENHEQEKIIWFVYECYPKNMRHAELIVRVPHLIMQYFNNPRRLDELRGLFIKLFEIFEGKIVADIKEALPGIEAKVEVEAQKNKKKIRNLSLLSIFVGFLALVGIIGGIFVTRSILFKPTYKFDEMSADDRNTVFRAPIIYKNTSLEFRGLFPEKSTIYEKLTSDHISQMLNGKPLDFSDPHLRYLVELITHNWQNLTEKLKEKFLTSNFTFQNESLKFEKLHEMNSEVFISLTSDQILDVLCGKELVVHKMIRNETKLYVERKFWDENMRAIYFSFMRKIDENESYVFSMYNSSERNKFFEDYYRDFVKKSFVVQLNEISKIKEDSDYKIYTFSDFGLTYHDDSRDEFILVDSLSSHKSFQFGFKKALKLANESKLFILSAEAGTGKTATFEHFTMRIKRKFPTQWVSYIDLKDHKALYKDVKTLQDDKKMLEIIFGLSSENEFERRIFEEFFEAGNLILLWNGFDEISPDYSEDVMKILGLIRDNTKNIQFLCTRPLYSDQLRLKFSIQTFTLVPFDIKDQENFVRMFLVSQKTEEAKIQNCVEKVRKIIKSTEFEEGFDTPLMLLMITELISNDVEVYETENLYEIYRKFVVKKIEIWKEKSEFARKFLPGFITEHRNFDMLKVYQSYAMKSEFQLNVQSYAYFYCLKLKIMRQKIPEELTSDEISRMGILYINGPKSFKFAHRTFAEFFIAQYLIENVYNAGDEPPEKEADIRIQVFQLSFFHDGVENFITSFFQTKNASGSKAFDPQISKHLRTKFQKFMLYNTHRGTSKFALLFNFFKKDAEVLKKLLQIDENETLYTAAFTYALSNYVTLNREFDSQGIRNLVRPYLTDDEFEKFIHGKNQKGVIFYSLYKVKSNYNREIMIQDEYELGEEILKIKNLSKVFEILVKNLTKNEIKELLKSQMILQDLINSLDHSSNSCFNEEMWNFIEKEFTESEQKEILINFFSSFRLLPYMLKNVKFYLNRLEKYFSGVEIYEILWKYNTIYLYLDSEEFEMLWNFLVSHTTREQQKTFLGMENSGLSEIKPPLNLLFYSVFFEAFDDTLNLYKSYFNATEMQEMLISSSADFLKYFVLNFKSDVKFVTFLKELFAENEKSLKDLLLRKVEPTNLNVFELMRDYSDSDNRLEMLSNLLDSPSN